MTQEQLELFSKRKTQFKPFFCVRTIFYNFVWTFSSFLVFGGTYYNLYQRGSYRPACFYNTQKKNGRKKFYNIGPTARYLIPLSHWTSNLILHVNNNPKFILLIINRMSQLFMAYTLLVKFNYHVLVPMTLKSPDPCIYRNKHFVLDKRRTI